MAMLNDFRSSIFKWISEYISAVKTSGIDPDVEFLNFDWHSELTEIKVKSAVGPIGFSVSAMDETFPEVSFGVAITCVDDINGFRHTSMMDLLFESLLPRSQIPVVDSSTGEKIGWMQVVTSTMPPMERTETRPIQMVLVRCLTSLTY